uniref:3-hydroxyacyl-CoA dehydrogenase NAD binding domain-containing protein n=1 Tax=Ananas comosus var. bracteatus TaxID=296719 RepID=A0A6V7PMD1_ANACO|nr:unnamed protein product [Ananas comosus var. bracteatus]
MQLPGIKGKGVGVTSPPTRASLLHSTPTSYLAQAPPSPLALSLSLFLLYFFFFISSPQILPPNPPSSTPRPPPISPTSPTRPRACSLDCWLARPLAYTLDCWLARPLAYFSGNDSISRLKYTSNLQELQYADVIIEAIVESEDVKKKLIPAFDSAFIDYRFILSRNMK